MTLPCPAAVRLAARSVYAAAASASRLARSLAKVLAGWRCSSSFTSNPLVISTTAGCSMSCVITTSSACDAMLSASSAIASSFLGAPAYPRIRPSLAVPLSRYVSVTGASTRTSKYPSLTGCSTTSGARRASMTNPAPSFFAAARGSFAFSSTFITFGSPPFTGSKPSSASCAPSASASLAAGSDPSHQYPSRSIATRMRSGSGARAERTTKKKSTATTRPITAKTGQSLRFGTSASSESGGPASGAVGCASTSPAAPGRPAGWAAPRSCSCMEHACARGGRGRKGRAGWDLRSDGPAAPRDFPDRAR